MADEKKDLYIGVKNDLSPFCVDLEALTRGLVVIGQSGCGKSFLLGRLIEEIIRKSSEKTQILIIDPNSDFYHGSKLKSKTRDFKNVFDKYYTEQLKDEHKEFTKLERKYYDELKFKEIKAQVFGNTEEFNLSWKYVTDPRYRFDKIIKADISSLEFRKTRSILITHLDNKSIYNLKDYYDAITELFYLLNNERTKNKYFPIKDHNFLKKVLPVHEVWELGEDITRCVRSKLWREKEGKAGLPERLFMESNVNVIQFENIKGNIDRNIVLAYIANICLETHKQSVVACRGAKESENKKELEKATNELRHTFILIDEAHNFVPEGTNDPHEKMLGELIHTIAAEGRKYGLHLILATQRPNKVKRGLLGECDNAIIMKMNSRSDLDHLAQEMRILDVKLLEPCLHFQGQGNALAVGEMTRMAPYVQLFKSAPRRTVEGGVDIPGF